MTTAAAIFEAVAGSIDPSTALRPLDYRRPFGEELIEGSGSDNIPKGRASNEAAQQRTRNAGLFAEVMEACLGYATHQPLHGTEVGSRFRYGIWNTRADLDLLAQAAKAGRHDVVEAMRGPCLAQLALVALGASWRLNPAGGRFPGRCGTLCGGRSYTVAKENPPNPGRYHDDQGRYKAPYRSITHADSQLGNVLSYAIGERQAASELGDTDAAARAHLGFGLYGWLSSQEVGYLRRLADLGGSGGPPDGAELDALAWALNLFNQGEAPLPRIPFTFIVTDRCKATLAERWVGSGSTSFMYGFVWYAEERPAVPLLDRITWWEQDRHTAWLAAGEPKRESDHPGVGVWDRERGVLRAQQNSGVYYDVASMSYQEGWAEVPVPGRVLLAVRVDEDGAEILEGGAVPPPPDGPQARLRRHKVGPKPGGLTRFSFRNVSRGSDGGPVDLLEIDGQPAVFTTGGNGRLKVGQTKYADLPPGPHVARLIAREGGKADVCRRKMRAD